MALNLKYDRDADALYVYLSDKPYSHGRDLDDERRIDFAADDTPVGVEFTCVSLGVDLTDLPRADEISGALREHDIRELA
jgi:uncharacterized protein YuzE